MFLKDLDLFLKCTLDIFRNANLFSQIKLLQVAQLDAFFAQKNSELVEFKS